jgi:hypothetical protein
MQFKDPVSYSYSVPGIIAAVVAGGEIHLFGEPVHNTAFSLVPPLRTYNYLQGHVFSFPVQVKI